MTTEMWVFDVSRTRQKKERVIELIKANKCVRCKCDFPKSEDGTVRRGRNGNCKPCSATFNAILRKLPTKKAKQAFIAEQVAEGLMLERYEIWEILNEIKWREIAA